MVKTPLSLDLGASHLWGTARPLKHAVEVTQLTVMPATPPFKFHAWRLITRRSARRAVHVFLTKTLLPQ